MTNRLILLVTAFLLLASCDSEETEHRKEYWSDANYPKYGLLSIRIIPDSLQDEYMETIKELVTVGREDASFIPENSLKYAKEIADQLYFRETEGMRIYLGEKQSIDIPHYQLDSMQLDIFNILKYGNYTDTIKVDLK